MKKRMIIGIMACAVLLAGCTIGKKENVKINENQNDVNEVKDSVEKPSDMNSESKIEIVDGTYNADVTDGKFDIGYGSWMFGDNKVKFYSINGVEYSCNCEDTGIYIYDYNEREKKEDVLGDLVQKDIYGEELTEEEEEKLYHFGATLVADDTDCSFLYVFDDTLFYLNKDGKACKCNYKDGKKEIIEPLRNFNISYMNVVNKKSIYFVSEGVEYQYVLGENIITKVKKISETFKGCCQTEHGMLYLLSKEEGICDLYLNDIIIGEDLYWLRGSFCGVDDNQFYCYKKHENGKTTKYVFDLKELEGANGVIEGEFEIH